MTSAPTVMPDAPRAMHTSFVTRLCAGVLLSVLAVCVLSADTQAQQAPQQPTRADLPAFLFDPTYYSTRSSEKKAVMDGNDIAFTFFNTGLLGGLGEVRANWPKGVPETYIGDVLPIIAVEFPVRLPNGRDTLLVNTITVSSIPSPCAVPAPESKLKAHQDRRGCSGDSKRNPASRRSSF